MYPVLIVIGVILLILILIKLYVIVTRGRCTSRANLNGKTVIVTGANTGIGKETAFDLASRGARVILACRNLKLAEEAKNEIVERTGNNNVVTYHLDLESLESVRKFSNAIHDNEERLDILVNNAGAGGLGNRLTNDGLHVGMQVNHFGPFLLTNLLLDLLKQSAPSRIVNVASLAYIFACLDPNDLNKDKTILSVDTINYANSKLCNILMSNELAAKLEGSNVTSNCVHPGSVRTELFRHMRCLFKYPTWLLGMLYFKSAKEGAQTSIHCAICEKVEGVSGKYFADCRPKWLLPKARNKALAEKVWNESVKFVHLAKNEIHY